MTTERDPTVILSLSLSCFPSTIHSSFACAALDMGSYGEAKWATATSDCGKSPSLVHGSCQRSSQRWRHESGQYLSLISLPSYTCTRACSATAFLSEPFIPNTNTPHTTRPPGVVVTDPRSGVDHAYTTTRTGGEQCDGTWICRCRGALPRTSRPTAAASTRGLP